MTVKSGGVTIAAKHLSVSQPSLSGQLKVLEDFLQIKLFKKVGRKNQLTREGAVIFGFCRQMFELSEEMHESITEKIPHASRKIYVGVSNEIAHSFVVEVISHFLKKYNPQLRPKVTMISGTHEKLEEQLRFREIDVFVSQLSAKNPDLENLKKVEVPVNLVCTDSGNLSKFLQNLSIAEILSPYTPLQCILSLLYGVRDNPIISNTLPCNDKSVIVFSTTCSRGDTSTLKGPGCAVIRIPCLVA